MHINTDRIERSVRSLIEDKQIRCALAGALVFGLLSQGMGLFNVYSVHDDANMLYTYGETYTLGRWLTHIIERLSGYVLINGDGVMSLPWCNGLLMLCCFAVSACFVVKALDIASPCICAFIGGLMISAPTVTSYMGYRYNAVQFGLAVLLASAGAYIATGHLRLKRGGIVAVCLIGCSAGTYQAFIPFAVCVILFWCIRSRVQSSGPIDKTELLTLLSKPLIVLFGVVFYEAVNHLYLWINNYETINYRGIDSYGSIPAQTYMLRILIAYKQFIVPSRDTLFYIYPSNIRYMYYLVGVIGVVLMIICLIGAYRRSALNGSMLTAMFMIVPLACNLMIVIAGVEVMYSTMTYAQIMPFVLVAMLADMGFAQSKHGSGRIYMQSFIVLVMLLNLMYVRYSNKLYMIAEYAQQEAITYFTTLITRIQSIDGYKTEYPVVYINEYNKNADALEGICAIPSYKDVWGDFSDVNVDPYWEVDTLISNYAWKYFMNNWCGYYPELADPEDYKESPEVINMPSYPDSGSIRIIDDIIVVKF